MSKKEQNQEIAVVETNTAIAVASAVDFFSDAGKGTKNADKDSFAIPFLSILQPLSPQITDGIEGAKAGLFINSVTGEMTDVVQMIPVAFHRAFLRWQPREKGGGYKGEFSPVDVETGNVEGLVKGDDGRYYVGGTNPKEHDTLKDTRSHFVLMVKADGSWSQALVSMSSTQIKKSKRWLSQIQGLQMTGPGGQKFNPPSFSHLYEAKGVKEQNDQGVWFGWDMKLVGLVTDGAMYAAAKAFHAQILSGQVQVAPPVSEETASGAPDGQF